MFKNIIKSLLIILIFSSCVSKKEFVEIRLLSFKNKSRISVDSARYDRFFNRYLSYVAGHHSFKRLNNQRIFTGLNLSMDSLIIFNASLNKINRVKIPFNKDFPISLLYFHNYDSIFIFLDRPYVKLVNDGKDRQIGDFYLIDGSGKIKNSYSLNEIPNIDNKSDSGLIILGKEGTYGNMISDGKIYLPFYIFIPSIEFKQSKIRLVCQYDLKRKRAKMLDIYVNSDDYMALSDKSVLMVPYIFIINDSALIYSFRHSPALYKYNITNGSKELLYKDDCFSNSYVNNAKYIIEYKRLEFAKKDSLYIRDILITTSTSSRIYMKEILDINFNNLGYTVLNPPKPSVFIEKGHLVLKVSNDLYKVKPVNRLTYSMQSFEDKFVYKKINTDSERIRIPKNSRFKERLISYSKEIGIKDSERVITINVDQTCSSTLEFLVNELNNNASILKVKKLKILFYSVDTKAISDLLKPYRELAGFFVIDNDKLFLKYFNSEEYGISRMFIKNGNNLTFLKQYTCDNVEPIYNKLLRR
jgi:hypothetical protein